MSYMVSLGLLYLYIAISIYAYYIYLYNTILQYYNFFFEIFSIIIKTYRSVITI